MIWCLPGFLGRASDWDALATAAAARALPTVEAVNLFGRPVTGSLTAWSEAFTDTVAQRDERPLLLGYSLGGRLALHALLADPDRWRGAVIISAHLGYDDPDERDRRRQDDDTWAERFEREAWDDVVRDWNDRPAFGGRPQALARPADAFDRQALAHGLRVWGLGQQEPLAARLTTMTCPVLWVAGARDPRFLAQAERAMQYLPRGALAVAPGAAHRVPWDAPEWFHTSACAFLESLT